MSWNEPGGGNNGPRDPWGGNNQGPPDLDEALKKLQQRLGGLFGGRGAGGSGSAGGGLSGALLGVVAAGAITVWALMGFYQLDEQERAIVLRFGEYSGTMQPGLQWNPPLIDEVIKVNTTKIRAAQVREVMLTQDENIVEVTMSLQYFIENPEKFVLEVRDPEVSLQHAAQSALRHVVGDSTMDLVLTEGRAALAIDVRDRLQGYLDSYGTGIRLNKMVVTTYLNGPIGHVRHREHLDRPPGVESQLALDTYEFARRVWAPELRFWCSEHGQIGDGEK